MGHIRKGYRATVVKSHLIFYGKSWDNQVEIISTLHQKMDIETKIKEKE